MPEKRSPSNGKALLRASGATKMLNQEKINPTTERAAKCIAAKDAVLAHAWTTFADTARGESARPKTRMAIAEEVMATASAIRPAA